MKKILKLLTFACLLFSSLHALDVNNTYDLVRMLHDSNGNIVKDFSEKAFPIKGIHKKLGLTCKDCHKEKDEKEFSSAMNGSCLQCHGSYAKIAEATGALGHNDNIHDNPHYDKLDCDTCHKAHKPTVNMCLRCHTQESMKSLIVK